MGTSTSPAVCVQIAAQHCLSTAAAAWKSQPEPQIARRSSSPHNVGDAHHAGDGAWERHALVLALMHVPVVSLAVIVRCLFPSFASLAHSFDWAHHAGDLGSPRCVRAYTTYRRSWTHWLMLLPMAAEDRLWAGNEHQSRVTPARCGKGLSAPRHGGGSRTARLCSYRYACCILDYKQRPLRGFPRQVACCHVAQRTLEFCKRDWPPRRLDVLFSV